MKKTLALLLALAICLSLAACGADKKYTPLLDALDAGDYEGVKQEMTVLSPDFAAEQAANAAVIEQYAEAMEKYGDLIALLEAEDYENALADVMSRVPVPEEPAYSRVEITLDNWQEYFEFVELEENWDIDAFGGVNLDLGIQKTFAIALKPAYCGKLRYHEETMLSWKVNCDIVEYAIDIDSVDTSTKTYTLGNVRNTEKNNDRVLTLRPDSFDGIGCGVMGSDVLSSTEWWGYYFPSSQHRENSASIRVIENLVVADVTGVIFLSED